MSIALQSISLNVPDRMRLLFIAIWSQDMANTMLIPGLVSAQILIPHDVLPSA